MLAAATITRAFLIATRTDLTGMDVRIWTNTLARLDPIAGGALLAVLLQGKIPKHTGRRRALWIASGGAVLWIAGSVLKDPGWIWLLTYPLAAGGCVAILYGAFTPVGGQGPGILVYLGKISYGLYVFHVAAIRLVQTMSPSLAGPLVLVIAFTLTVGLAALSYRFLESPFLRLKNRFERIETRAV
jgi:peptidoglycan/LPS O-acetylase OafA/YrhL